MVAFVKYDLDSGAYIAHGDAPESMLSVQALEGEGIRLGHIDPATEYVDINDPEHRNIPREPMNAMLQDSGDENGSVTLSADGNSTARITGIPPSTTVMVGGPVTAYDLVDDGDYEITFDHPGDYTIRLTHPIRLPQEFLVHAT